MMLQSCLPRCPSLLRPFAAATVALLLAAPWSSTGPATAQAEPQAEPATLDSAQTTEGLLITWRESDLSEGGGDVTEVLGLLVPGHMRLDGHTVSSSTAGPQATGSVDNLSLIFLADPDRFLVIQRQTGEVTEIRARMIELAEATLAQQMDESETMAAQLEATQQANILARITAYRHYLTSYNEVYTRELSPEEILDMDTDDQPCRLVGLERERLTSDGSRQRREVSRACTVPAAETGIPVWARDLLSRLSRVTDRAVRLRRLTASIERGIAPPVDGDDVNPYAVLDDMPLRRWRLQNGQEMWKWQLLRVARLELPMAIFDPDATATLPAASAGETLWSHHNDPQSVVATRAPIPPAGAEMAEEAPVVAAAQPVTLQMEPMPEEPVQEQPIQEQPVQPIQEQPVQPIQEQPVQPIQEQPVQPIQEQPVQEQPVQELTLQPLDESDTATTTVEASPPTSPPIASPPAASVSRAEKDATGAVSSDALAQARTAFESYKREQEQGRLDALFYQLQRGEVRITAERPGRGGSKTYVVLIARPGDDGIWTIHERGVQPTP